MLKGLLILLVVAYLGLAAVAFFLSDRMMFLPPVSSYSAQQLPVVLVPTADGAEVATLHVPRPGATFTILYSHGNAEDLGQLGSFLEAYRDAGFSVLAYDYRGYGLSTGGPPSAKGAERDLEAVYRYAIGSLGIPASRIVLLGRSVGSGPATALAAREPVAGLIVESGFVSAFRVVTRVRILPFDRFANLLHIRDVECPVLVIHGTDDEVIPASHGRRLFEAAPEPKESLWVEGARHNDLVAVAGERYWRTLQSFGDTLRSRSSPTLE